MAPKNISVYSVAELITLDREQLLQFKQNIEEALSESEQQAIDQVKELVAKFGLDPKQLALSLGIKVDAPKPAPAPAASSTRAAKDEDPRITDFKQKYADRIVKNHTGKGKDYHVGKSRGAFPSWLSEKITAGQVDQLQIESDEDYAERIAGVGAEQQEPAAAE